MRGLIGIEGKRYELIECCTYYGAFKYDLDIDLDIFKVKFWKWCFLRNGRDHWHGMKGMWVKRVLDSHCDISILTSLMTLTSDFQGKILKLLYLRNRRVDSLGMKGMWVGYDVKCTMVLTLGCSGWQIDRPSNESMWNSHSSQPVAPWMGLSLTDLGAEGCCRPLNALFVLLAIF